MPRGIFYRGDDRRPTGIFSNGFQVLELPKPKVHDPDAPPPHSGLFQFPDNNENIAPDIASGKVVCVTRDFFAAAIFPVDMSTVSYIYVLDLDTKYLINTQASQYRYVQSIAGRLTPDGIKTALWPMFGQERAASGVSPADIVGAIKITRAWNSSDNPFAGGQFKMQGSFIDNEDYAGSNGGAIAVAVETTMQRVSNDAGWVQIPTKAQGISRVEPV